MMTPPENMDCKYLSLLGQQSQKVTLFRIYRVAQHFVSALYQQHEMRTNFLWVLLMLQQHLEMMFGYGLTDCVKYCQNLTRQQHYDTILSHQHQKHEPLHSRHPFQLLQPILERLDTGRRVEAGTEH
jgi:hypothetical protein